MHPTPAEIVEILTNNLTCNHNDQVQTPISRDAKLVDLMEDSLDVVIYLFDVEDEFGFNLTHAEEEAVKTFGDLVDLVERKLQEGV